VIELNLVLSTFLAHCVCHLVNAKLGSPAFKAWIKTEDKNLLQVSTVAKIGDRFSENLGWETNVCASTLASNAHAFLKFS